LAKKTKKLTNTSRASLADDIYIGLKQEIMSLTLAPRTILDETALVERFGVSRTPVREAIRKLAADGLVDMQRHQSARVKPVLLENLRDYFECIRVIQKAVLVLAAARASDDNIKAARVAQADFENAIRKGDVPALPALNNAFHMALARGADNSFLYESYGRVLNEGARLSAIGVQHQKASNWPERVERISADHRAMVDALANRDQRTIADLSDKHIELFRENLLATLTHADTENLIGEISEIALSHVLSS
jgi:DNA-binding GntR family transcriptional regulator